MGNPIGSLDVVAAEEHDHETASEYRCCCEWLHVRDGIRVFASITLLVAGLWLCVGLFTLGAVALMPNNVTSSHIDQLSSRFDASHASSISPESMLNTLRVMIAIVAAIFTVLPLVEFIFALLVFFGVARRKSWLIIPYMADQLLSCLLLSTLAVLELVALFFSDGPARVAFLLGLIYFGLYAAYTGLAAWTAWKAIRWAKHVKSCEGNPIRMSTIMTPTAPIYYKQ